MSEGCSPPGLEIAREKCKSLAEEGEILEGSPDTFINESPAARVGDAVCCEIHGETFISETSENGSPDTFHNEKRAARCGDALDCGGIIITGSPDTFINEKFAARVGDRIGHEGGE